MPDLKISELSEATNLTAAQIPIAQAGVTKRAPAALFATPADVAGAVSDANDYTDGAIATEVTNRNNAIASAVTGLLDNRGVFDASVNAYPSSGGSGTAGAIIKSDFWIISVAGTLPTGLVVEIGDMVFAKVDTPGNTEANWGILQYNLGYTPLNSADKASVSEINTGSNNTKYITPLNLEGSKILDQSSNKIYVEVSGANTYTGTITPVIAAYVKAQSFNVLFTDGNTGSATLNLNSLGAIGIKKNVSEDLSSGDILAGQIIHLVYDGSFFQIISGVELVKQTITNGVTGSAPSQDAVYDALLNKQPLDSDLTDIAGLSPSDDDIIQRKAGSWINRNMQQLSSDLGNLIAVAYHSGVTLADSTNYFFGNRYSDTAQTAFGSCLERVTKTRIISKYIMMIFSASNASNESVPIYIRVNNTTDYLIDNFDYSLITINTSEIFSGTIASPITLASTDEWEIKIGSGSTVWTTNPTNARHNLKLYE